MSEFATLDVMRSHAGAATPGPGSPFFPTPAPALAPPAPGPTPGLAHGNLKERVAAVPGLSATDLRSADKADIEHILESLLSALKNLSSAQLQLGERHSDGSLSITSHLAVWLIGKVTDAYGGKLVRLSQVSNREKLRSLSGLAELLHGAISKDQEAGPS